MSYKFGRGKNTTAVIELTTPVITPNEIFLILEVSDTTLSYDRNDKFSVYVRAGIRQYLLLNVQDKKIEDYRKPSADGYQSKQIFRAGQTFKSRSFSRKHF